MSVVPLVDDGAAVLMPRRRRRRRAPGLIAACFAFVGIVLVMVIFGSLIAPHDPNAQNLTATLLKPGGSHWLGTDELGRDVFSRLIAGARTAFVGPLLIAIVSMLVGNVLGLYAGYHGGWVDSALMRWVDFMWALPGLLVVIVIAGAVGSGYWIAIVVLTLFTIPFDARVVRGATLEQVPRPYVEAAKSLGASDRRIMLRYIWPNVSPLAVTNAFLVFAGSLVAVAGLSFLGLGAPIGTPDWGLMVSANQQFLFINPVATLAPAVMIVLTATSMNLIGDWLYEWMSSRGATR